MRIIHTADWHLGKNIKDKSRLQEQESYLDFFVQKNKDLKPDLILIAGDIYDTTHPPVRAEQLLYENLKHLTRGGDCLVLLIAGNHDSPERLSSAVPLAKEHGIIILGTPKTVIETGTYGKHRVVNSGEGFLEVEIGGERAVIITLPYPSEKRLNEVFYGDDEDEEERLLSYQDKMAALFQKLEKNFREDTINLTVSHLFVFGSSIGGTERTISLGGSFALSSDILPKKAHYTALGHIHRPQILPKTNGRARYSGSPLAYSIDETEYQKKFYVVDIDEKREVKIDEVDIPVFKPIELWTVDSIEEAIEKCEANRERDVWAYLEIKTDRPIREDEMKAMKSSVKDLLEIKPIMEFEASSNSRVDISELSIEEQFIEFHNWKTGIEPRRELLELFVEIWREEDETN